MIWISRKTQSLFKDESREWCIFHRLYTGLWCDQKYRNMFPGSSLKFVACLKPSKLKTYQNIRNLTTFHSLNSVLSFVNWILQTRKTFTREIVAGKNRNGKKALVNRGEILGASLPKQIKNCFCNNESCCISVRSSCRSTLLLYTIRIREEIFSTKRGTAVREPIESFAWRTRNW